MTRSTATALLIPALLVILGACASGAAAPPPTSTDSSPGSSPAPSATTTLPVTTPDQAAALVIARDARFTGVVKQDPNLIGGCCFYQATSQGADSFAVTIEIGWGDCPAGCVNHHHWIYAVTADGTVTLKSEDGPPVPAGTGGGILPGGPGIAGQALAGPTCPVVQPGSSCNDRPVAGATILIRDAGGTVVAQVVTDANGRFQVGLPPGPYRVEPQPVQGLIGTAGTIDVTVGAAFETVRIGYDTGIR
ncbi:MAG TPA: carboxypeptidase-like regulatory domain-containing protein [Candidatus Limnocylindrales bacterium]